MKKLDKVYSVLQDRYKYAQDFETANEEDYILEAIEEVKSLEEKLKKRNCQIADLKYRIKELQGSLICLRTRIADYNTQQSHKKVEMIDLFVDIIKHAKTRQVDFRLAITDVLKKSIPYFDTLDFNNAIDHN